MKPVLIIRTGRAPDRIRARHGDFPQWFQRAARLPTGRVRIVDVAAGEELPAPRLTAGAIITGSGAMVTERLDWSERTAAWLRDAMDVDLPLFGVCYGHQLMAHALGGRVDYLPGGREIGTQTITRLAEATPDILLDSAPERFAAHTTHEQAVLEPPPGAVQLARSERDPHQVLRYGKHAISTQFHPEFSAEVMRAYVLHKAGGVRRELQQLDVFRDVAATPEARSLLARFARRAGWHELPASAAQAAGNGAP
ncbi:MAG TPA: glutamine amidotransferase [Rhodanobacter sp.]|jgi:GMP synthase (glutamine-hydrolysing)|nr:glutamine amidotransferase [Rhodanobacter sp.]